jgi:hypothetical protein
MEDNEDTRSWITETQKESLYDSGDPQQQPLQVDIYIQQVLQHKDVTHLTLIQIVPHKDGDLNETGPNRIDNEAPHTATTLSLVGVQIRRLTISVSYHQHEDPWVHLRMAMEGNINDNHANDNIPPPPHLVLIDAETTQQVTTASPTHLLNLLEIFTDSQRMGETSSDNNNNNDHHEEDTFLTVVFENKGSRFRTTHNRHFIGKVLVHAKQEENDESWELMTDYTLRLPPPPALTPESQRQHHHYHDPQQEQRLRQQQLRNYVLLFADDRAQAHWHVNEAVWNRRIRTGIRIDETRKGGDNDDDDVVDWMVVDSALLLPLMYPTKQSEVEFCRSFSPSRRECQPGGGTGIDLTKSTIPISDLEVQKSQQGSYAGRGLYTKVDILPNTLIGADQPMVVLEWPSTEILNDFRRGEETNSIYERLVDSLYSYIDGYGVVHEWQVRCVDMLDVVALG